MIHGGVGEFMFAFAFCWMDDGYRIRLYHASYQVFFFIFKRIFLPVIFETWACKPDILKILF